VSSHLTKAQINSKKKMRLEYYCWQECNWKHQTDQRDKELTDEPFLVSSPPIHALLLASIIYNCLKL
jgi:hypothetical protein